MEAALLLPDAVDLRLREEPHDEGRRLGARWAVTPRRWGRHDLGPVRLRAVTAFGLYATTFDVPVERVTVYPGGGTVASAARAPRAAGPPR